MNMKHQILLLLTKNKIKPIWELKKETKLECKRKSVYADMLNLMMEGYEQVFLNVLVMSVI